MTIEAVAARSGVARTTIYRRFENRRELIAAAIDLLVDQPLPPVEHPLEAKARWELDQVTELFETALGRGTVAAIIADSDPTFTDALRHALDRRLDELRDQIQADIDHGVVATGTDPDALIGLLFGACFGEVLRHGTPRGGWSDTIVTLLTRALATA